MVDIRDIRRKNLHHLVAKFKSKAEFSRRYGVNPAYVSQLLNKHRNFGEKAARNMEQALGMAPYSLDRPIDDMKISSLPDATENANVEPGPEIIRKVPLISWVQAGEWSEVVDMSQPGYAEEWCETTAKVGPNAFALRVRGDSMTAPAGLSIPEGAVVIVDPDATYTSGSIVVAKLDDIQEAILKRLVIDGPNKYLKPLNLSYAPIPISGNCRIIGVAKKLELDLAP